MFEENKLIYIYSAEYINGTVELILFVGYTGILIIFYDNKFTSEIRKNLDDITKTLYKKIMEKLVILIKIYKQFKTNIIIKSKLLKYISNFKERFYNPDTPNNFMKKHAKKYTTTLGTLIQ